MDTETFQTIGAFSGLLALLALLFSYIGPWRRG